MKIAIMGAGAVGCYYGGLLALAGHEVVLIGRPPAMARIAREGLRIHAGGHTRVVCLKSGSEAALLADAELVLCCVKSDDTARAAQEMAPHLAAGARVLSLQNGVDNAAGLAARLRQPVFAAVVYVAVALSAPGEVRYEGGGRLLLGPDALDASQRVAFEAADIQIEICTDLRAEQWRKLVINCCWNPLSAITRQPYGTLWQQPASQALMRQLMNECLAVAQAEGVALPAADTLWQAVAAIAELMPGQFSSTAQDLARGRASEIDHLNGYIARRAAAHGLHTPLNQTLHSLVRLSEAPRAA